MAFFVIIVPNFLINPHCRVYLAHFLAHFVLLCRFIKVFALYSVIKLHFFSLKPQGERLKHFHASERNASVLLWRRSFIQ